MTLPPPAELLVAWLERDLSTEAFSWFQETLESLRDGGRDSDLYLAISLAPRKTGKNDLGLRTEDLEDASAVRPGWNPRGWSVDQATRLALLLTPPASRNDFARRLEQIFLTADVGELVTFYRSLPLLPEPERWVSRAAEGVRSNMKAVFEAVAHRNPFPREHFEEGIWNQMVLKALFVGSSLHEVVGLDERANPTLSTMLVDYAHERWAAARTVSPELWRCVGPFADEAALEDLQRVLETGTLSERQAAALALSVSPSERAHEILTAHHELANAIESKRLSWETCDRTEST